MFVVPKIKAPFISILMLGLLLAGSIQLIVQHSMIKAQSESLWISDSTPIVDTIEDSIPRPPLQRDCDKRHMDVINLVNGLPMRSSPEVCIVEANFGTFGYTTYNNTLYFKKGKYGAAYQFDLPRHFIYAIPNSDKLAIRHGEPGSVAWVNRMQVYNNAKDIMEFDHAKQMYKLKPTAIENVMIDPSTGNDYYRMRTTATFSNNGQWMILVTAEGFRKVDLSTNESTLFGNVGSYGLGANPGYSPAITNDGRYVFIGGIINAPNHLVYDTAFCERPPLLYPYAKAQGCKEIKLNQAILPGYTAFSLQNSKFNDNGDTILANMYVNSTWKRIAIRAPGAGEPKLQYLALGDSFSSGEGDWDGNTYYLPGTDVQPYEKCHLSTRSYPYLLAHSMLLIPEIDFRSVACSGAQMVDIFEGKDSYAGQNNRVSQLILAGADSEILVKEAQINFTPGIILQNQFVETSKPKIITIGIGGNDVDFGHKIMECISKSPLGDSLHIGRTCSHATERSLTGFEIQKQFTQLKTTYRHLKASSSGSVIFAVGYPQFIAKNSSSCLGSEEVRLDAAEREYIRHSVSYLNDVIEAAAKSEGIMYLDIEDALEGRNLCSGHPFPAFNGIRFGDDIDVIGKQWIGQESFHPNANGHSLIAGLINEKYGRLDNYSLNFCSLIIAICSSSNTTAPLLPDYFLEYQHQDTPIQESMIDSAKILGMAAIDTVNDIGSVARNTLNIGLSGLKNATSINLYAHSEPTFLGTYTSDENGNFSGEINIPYSLNPGYHTLHAYAELPTGEKVHFYQRFILLGKEGDYDENGIDDTIQPCPLFVSHTGTDIDQDSIDDGCDDHIGEPPVKEPEQLYRARIGSESKKDNRQYIYLERNVLLAKERFGYEDFDEDDDGWAIVGRTMFRTFDARIEELKVDTDNPSIIVYDSIRGCMELKPINYDKAIDVTIRPLTPKGLQIEIACTLNN